MDDAKRIRAQQVVQLAREFYIRADGRDIMNGKKNEAARCIQVAQWFFEASDEYMDLIYQNKTQEGE